jgi:partner of Y14 and mago protein
MERTPPNPILFIQRLPSTDDQTSPSPSPPSPLPSPPSSVRKERKIRPGFTPQEDVARFRSARQQAQDARALPKGHVPGWAPPGAPAPATKKEPQSKSAKKNEKRKEKRMEKRQEPVQENWDSEADEDVASPPEDNESRPIQASDGTTSPQGQQDQKEGLTESKIAAAAEPGVDAVADKLHKLTV